MVYTTVKGDFNLCSYNWSSLMLIIKCILGVFTVCFDRQGRIWPTKTNGENSEINGEPCGFATWDGSHLRKNSTFHLNLPHSRQWENVSLIRSMMSVIYSVRKVSFLHFSHFLSHWRTFIWIKLYNKTNTLDSRWNRSSRHMVQVPSRPKTGRGSSAK